MGLSVVHSLFALSVAFPFPFLPPVVQPFFCRDPPSFLTHLRFFPAGLGRSGDGELSGDGGSGCFTPLLPRPADAEDLLRNDGPGREAEDDAHEL